MRSLQMQIWPQFSKRESTAALTAAPDVGILRDHERCLPAEFEAQKLEVVGGVAEHFLASANAAGERDQPRDGVAHQGAAQDSRRCR